jgi:hypothetical protein
VNIAVSKEAVSMSMIRVAKKLMEPKIKAIKMRRSNHLDEKIQKSVFIPLNRIILEMPEDNFILVGMVVPKGWTPQMELQEDESDRIEVILPLSSIHSL